MAVGKERENLKVDREKKNKLLIYIATITMQICTVTIASLYIHIFTSTDMGSFGEKLCKFCTILTLFVIPHVHLFDVITFLSFIFN